MSGLQKVNKDAYLIMAHKDDLCFRTLISMLDDEKNDIYIHMDIKCSNFRQDEIVSLLKKSDIYFIPRRNNIWGGIGLTNTELVLLETARSHGCYRYYHLLSGQDLPIKSNNDIWDFFEMNNGKEFVDFFDKEFHHSNRVAFYYLFQNLIGKDRSFLYKIQKLFIKFQKLIGICRNKEISFQKGAQWFSITDDLASYVLNNKDFINKHFKYTIFADEMFMQTLVINSNFRDKLYNNGFNDDPHSIMRLIDWDRGNGIGSPHIFTIEDYELIKNSEFLFARKFDESVDKTIIKMIIDNISNLDAQWQ